MLPITHTSYYRKPSEATTYITSTNEPGLFLPYAAVNTTELCIVILCNKEVFNTLNTQHVAPDKYVSLLKLMLNAETHNSFLVCAWTQSCDHFQYSYGIKCNKRHNLSFGSRAFRISVPKNWNTLSLEVRQSNSFSTFRNRLKTFCFRSAYPSS